jgi:hypothetical protein
MLTPSHPSASEQRRFPQTMVLFTVRDKSTETDAIDKLESKIEKSQNKLGA